MICSISGSCPGEPARPVGAARREHESAGLVHAHHGVAARDRRGGGGVLGTEARVAAVGLDLHRAGPHDLAVRADPASPPRGAAHGRPGGEQRDRLTGRDGQGHVYATGSAGGVGSIAADRSGFPFVLSGTIGVATGGEVG